MGMAFEYTFAFRKEVCHPSPAFPLRKFIIRPRVRIKLIHGDRSVEVIALIDSGADNSLFEAELGEAIGLDIERGYQEQTVGVGGVAIDVYFHDIELEIRDLRWRARVGFIRELASGALAGRDGFFTKFAVCVDQPNGKTTLTTK